MSACFLNSSAGLAFVTSPSPVFWSYLAGGVVFAIGLVVIFLRGDWQKARRFDTLLLFGPLFFAAPVAAFGTEHFTITQTISSMVPAWLPWHLFWAYFVGACFIAAALSLVTGVQSRLAASLLALNFFLFVLLMDVPGWARHPHDRFALALALRELSFSGGALALAATLTQTPNPRRARLLANVARYFIAVPLLFYSLEQFRHGNYVPAIPLNRITPTYVLGHAFWTYLAAAVYAVAGTLLLLGARTRAAAASIGLTVLIVELIVYVPIAVADRATLVGINYLGDTLMYCGAVLLLAGAMPRAQQQEPSALSSGARAV